MEKNLLKNFFKKIKMFFCKTKDFNALVIYIILFCCMGFIMSGAFIAPVWLIGNFFMFFLELLDKFGLQAMGILLYGFSAFCIPMAITKLFLEKRWSKYLSYFFDHIQYPTIVLICYIIATKIFNIDMEELYWQFTSLAFYSVYFIIFLRKFIKPVYEHFFKIYFGLIILLGIF